MIRIFEVCDLTCAKRVDDLPDGTCGESRGGYYDGHVEATRSENWCDVKWELATVRWRKGRVRRPDGERADVVRVHSF